MSPEETHRDDPHSRIHPTGSEDTIIDEVGNVGTVIGHYRLLQRLGEGGMGEVWLAEQKDPVRRRAALKLIKAGMNSREVIARFESERQALALMDHPTIARVFDAGTTPGGLPYFVMEYVAGLSITDYCDHHRLGTRERLELFIRVCEGVQHAHQKAIIHRDLKPSNILVTQVDDRPAPKIIDFGVAKALTHSLTSETMFTRVGTMVGTPEYMSPEQALSSGMDVDTRSDVYSLGIIFYELLAGVPPLDLKKIALEEFLRRLREDDAPKPSTKIRTQDSATATELARKRHTDASKLVAELRGDLDSIALKALEKDRSRRYASPSELAADLRRYLSHLPVLATPPSSIYRFRKFAQRKRGLLALTAALLTVLVAGTVISIYEAIRARSAERAAIVQRDRADAEAATAKAVSNFLQEDLLSQAGADQQTDLAPDPDVKVRTLVDRAAASVPKKFAGNPAVQADLRNTLAVTYVSLGLLSQAKEQASEAYALNQRVRGPYSEKTIDSLMTLSTIEFNASDYSHALAHNKTAWETAIKGLGPQAPLTLQAQQSLAVDYMVTGERSQAEPLLKEVLDIQVRRYGYDNADTLNTSDSLAMLYLDDGRYDAARQLLERGLESYRKVFGADHPNTQRELYALSRVLYGIGDYARAEQLATTVYDSYRRLLGHTHFKTLAVARQLARIYESEGKLGASEALATDTLQMLRVGRASDPAEVIYVQEVLARVDEDRGQYAKAGSLLIEAERASDQVLGESNPDTLVAVQLLAKNLLHRGQCAAATGYLQEANLRWDAHPAIDDWRRFEGKSLLGESYTCEGKFAKAEPILLSGYDGLKRSAGRMPAYEQSQIKQAAARLVRLYAGWKKPAAAARWQAATR